MTSSIKTIRFAGIRERLCHWKELWIFKTRIQTVTTWNGNLTHRYASLVIVMTVPVGHILDLRVFALLTRDIEVFEFLFEIDICERK